MVQVQVPQSRSSKWELVKILIAFEDDISAWEAVFLEGNPAATVSFFKTFVAGNFHYYPQSVLLLRYSPSPCKTLLLELALFFPLIPNYEKSFSLQRFDNFSFIKTFVTCSFMSEIFSRLMGSFTSLFFFMSSI